MAQSIDLAANFYDPDNFLSLCNLLHLGDAGYDTFARQFQEYLLSHARTGSPNTIDDSGAIKWQTVEFGPVLGNVMNASDSGFALFDDPATTARDSDF